MYTYNISKNLCEILNIDFEENPNLSDQNLTQLPDDATQSHWNKSGWRHSEESKKLMSERLKGRKAPNRGRPLSEEHKQAISNYRKGKPTTKGRHNPFAAANGRKGALKLSKTVTGRKRKYLSDGTWTWEYPKLV